MKLQKLELKLLGTPQVLLKKREVKLTKKSLALLAYLALEGVVQRQTLAELLWGGVSNASGNLRRELHRLRETEIKDFLEITNTTVQLLAFQTDLEVFSEAGEFLQGLQLSDAPEFETWLEQQRLDLSKKRLEQMRNHAARLELTDVSAAIVVYQEIMLLEPLSDFDSQALLRCLLNQGQRDEAERVFDLFKQRLAEIGLTPKLETAQLLVSDSANAEGSAKLLERLGRGKEAITFRLAAAAEAEQLHDYAASFEHFGNALQLQKIPSEKAGLHKKRIELLYRMSKVDEIEKELLALEQCSRGDSRLEGEALVTKAQWLTQTQNFAAALETATAALRNPLLSKEASSLAQYVSGACNMRLGKLAEANIAFRQAVDLLPIQKINERVHAHYGLAQLEMQRGNISEARALHQTALTLLQDTDERFYRPGILSMAGIFAMMDGENLKALEWLEMAKRECESSNNAINLAMVLVNISKVYANLGDNTALTATLEEAIEVARVTGNPVLEGSILNNLAISHYQRGNLGVAIETGLAGIECARKIKDTRGLVARLLAQVEYVAQVGDFVAAWNHLAEAKQLMESTGLQELQSHYNLQKADLLLAEGNYKQSLDILELLVDHTNQEIRLASLYSKAIALEQLQQPIPSEILEELSGNQQFATRILALKIRLEPTQENLAAGQKVLPTVTGLEELALRIALAEPYNQVLEHLTQSLETYPELQQGFQSRLKQQYSITRA